LGGYARRELCPSSDVDLLLLHDGWHRTGLEALVERLCYPLWDARLSVGHAVRTANEAVKDAGERIDTATSLLDRRFVAGDRGLADALTSRTQRWVRRRGNALVSQLAAADAERHRAGDSHPGMLEPDLKNGAGGLRDVHSLRWAAGWMVGEVGLDPLVAAGYLGAEDRRRLGHANEVLLRARCALHLVAPNPGKQGDILRLDRQDEVAALLGDADADDLLRAVGLAARTIGHLHDRTWRLLLADAAGGRRRRRAGGIAIGSGLQLVDGLVGIDADASLVDDAALGLRAIAGAASHDTHLSRKAATRLADDVTKLRALRWTDDARAALVALLGTGDKAADALAEADHLGLLTAHLPEWERVRGRSQRNALHRFDLDTHGARAVVALHRLRRDESLDLVWQRVDNTAALLLATWLHDVGKAWPGDHSVVGADVVGRWLSDMGFDQTTVERAAALVRHHLLLPDVATRRDLEDAAEIKHVADLVGDAPTLDSLYLLSLADAQATGPAAWSSWKGMLVATLYERVRAHLAGATPSAEVDPFRDAAANGADPAQLDALRRQAPAEYLLVAGADQVGAHAQLLSIVADGEPAAVDIRPGSVAETNVVSVVAHDRPGLLADCTGVLAANELAVVEARAVTTSTGMALEWLTVTGDVAPTALCEQMADAIAGRIDVASLVDKPRRRQLRVTPAPWRTPTVTIRDSHALEVETADQPALLYRLCAVIAQTGVSLRAVRISTLAHTVFDVFELAEPATDEVLAALRDDLLVAAAPPRE
jgi:[protein-PII] uridylyltransferase